MTDKKNMSKIFIALDVAKETYSQMDEIRKRLGKKTNVKMEYPPLHITLRPSFYTQKVKSMLDSLDNFVPTYPAFYVNTKKFDFFEEDYLVALVYKSSTINDFHKNIIEKTMPFQDEVNLQEYENLNEKQEKYKQIYGSPFVLEYFQPHTTLLYHINNYKELLSFSMKHEHQKFKFKAETVSVVEKFNGNYKVLKKMNLKK